MKAIVNLNAHYPTVQYGNVDVGLTIELDEGDIPPPQPGQDKAEHLGNTARWLLMREWAKLRDDIEAQLLQRLYTLDSQNQMRKQ